jgi:hypothetical protein
MSAVLTHPEITPQRLELRNPSGSKSAGVAARIFEELGATTLQRLFAFELRRREYAAAARISAGGCSHERPNSITAERFNMPRWSDSNFGMREDGLWPKSWPELRIRKTAQLKRE